MGNMFSLFSGRKTRTTRNTFSNVVVEQNVNTTTTKGAANQGATIQGAANQGAANQTDRAVEGVPIHEGVVTAALPNASGQAITLRVTAEKEALAAREEHKLLAMLSLKAPNAPETSPRAPLDIVVAADRSGSMSGQKIQLMRQTLDLLLKRSGLNAEDRFALVSFDSQVKLEHPLEEVDAAGKAKAEGIVRRLQPGSTTNLSGGALEAIDVLRRSSNAKTKAEKRTRAVMLFTDGLANEGIRETSALCSAVSGALRAASTELGGSVSLFTFGFGSDHNEECLRRLANESTSAGQYYYVRSAEDIPNAFADCLGGLTSVVAQNATLLLEAVGGASIVRVLGSAYSYSDGNVALGDLFAEDEKDVIVEMSLPTLPTPIEHPTTIIKASLRAFNITTNAPDVVDATLEMARPAATPANQQVNIELDAQRNRLETAEAMERAMALADRGDVEGGRETLQLCAALVQGSASAGRGSSGKARALSQNLVSEVKDLEATFTSAAVYRNVGSKLSRMKARSHQVQRGNHMDVSSYASASSSKAAMKARWRSSLANDDDDSD